VGLDSRFYHQLHRHYSPGSGKDRMFPLGSWFKVGCSCCVCLASGRLCDYNGEGHKRVVGCKTGRRGGEEKVSVELSEGGKGAPFFFALRPLAALHMAVHVLLSWHRVEPNIRADARFA
jgi:hypothetical protein